jgi:HD-GYP domain-containing protein (c-di-GMP phosphodiesterase class II)
MGLAVDAQSCLPLVESITASVWRNGAALVSLARLKTHDDYSYMHSVAVCALMVSLARQLGQGEDQARTTGMAGLLHDLGKALMPLDVLNKPGKLTAAEFDIMKQHPLRGHELLSEARGADEQAMDVCLHHHEKFDGSGYPEGLSVAAIGQMARMGAICDVYDAITSNRPYKAGWDPAESIARMASWKGHFDEDILKAFIRSIGIYPTGSLVRLASGRLAIVVEQNRARLTAPKVKVFFSTKSNMPLKPELLDLLEAEGRDRIERRESPGDWQFEYLNELWAGDLPIARTLDSRTQYRRPG